MTTRAAFLVMALLLSGCSASGPVTPYLYDNGPDYLSEGLMRIQDSSGKIGYADEKGKIVISPQFAFGYPFKNGHAKVTLQGHEEVVPGSNGEMHIWQSEQWLCIDRSGRRVDCIETPLKP